MAVFEAGGIGKGAERLNTVQSNVTSRIQRLEANLGVQLFKRHTRGVELTPAGKRLLPVAEQISSLLGSVRAIARDDSTPQGQLTIGALETTSAIHLPKLLSGYAKTFPQVDLTLRTGTTMELTQQVLNQTLDGAFVCGPVVHPRLRVERVYEEELVLLAEQRFSDLSQIVALGEVSVLVLRIGCSYRRKLEEILANKGVSVSKTCEFGTFDAIFGCVSAGLGITVVPRSMLPAVAARWTVSTHDLPLSTAVVETLFIRRASAHVQTALSKFVDHVREASNLQSGDRECDQVA
ncbi:transcriptional regulator [Acetobacter aceti NRIC 0242]|uniref:LysR family transcriptional regulator n=1 Tax=Acetobacter aceti NBRC 14818 TaxID=887700 RepID=A0AB33IFR4_ACEAC|nr:LysR substrate-binding domain-containing protein [Acetobacter aceti]TCS25624.1 DNA-binding transcriptional LysR family regulator [Acetobacter aceti NBRC 14818]BCK75833.1 LysR family transcriptional regulator [Acetobacter aceti NBRC 14818]GAN58014.1 transcriptional regulator LysR [Acetobacter aceti NBRC 14818]GBO81891.1 transcriptional regulator [Acetobacter aceti NRIC 0242]